MKINSTPFIRRMIMYGSLSLFFHITCCCLLLAKNGAGQSVESIKRVRINVSFTNNDMISVFKEIEKITPYSFVYNSYDINRNIMLTRSYRHKTVYRILSDIAALGKINFKQLNRNISVFRSNHADLLSTVQADSLAVFLESTNPAEIIIQLTITGTVTTAEGQPMPGVNVSVKGTGNGTITDGNGNFILEAAGDATLVFSFIGFTSQEVPLNGRSAVSVSMQEDIKTLQQVVVVGYGTQTKKEITGAIASVSSKDFKEQPVANFEQSIVGKLAGVQVVQSTGAPGGSISVRVRGLSSITAGSEPLYVVDGFPISNDARDLQLYLNPNTAVLDNNYQKAPNPMSSFNNDDVESIEVLKDASSAAIYGSRGSGGVVLITTKKGSKDGKPRVSYNMYYGFQEITKKLKLLDAYQWSTLAREGKINAYLDANRSKGVDAAAATTYVDNATPDVTSFYTLPSEIKPYLQGQQSLTNTDWQDAIYRTAPIQNHTVSVSGGNDKVQYYVSGNYFKQEGIVIASGFDRFGLKANVTAQVTPRLTVGASVTPARTSYDLVNTEGGWFQEGVINIALKTSPIFPVYNQDGTYAVDRQNTWNKTAQRANPYGFTNGENPVALANLINDKLINVRSFNNVYAQYELIKGLTFKSYFGTDIMFVNRNYFHPSTLGYSNFNGAPLISGNPANNLAFSQSGYSLNWLWENTLNYIATRGESKFNFLAGYTSQKNTTNTTFASTTNFPNDAVTTLNAGATPTSSLSDAQAWSLLSYLGRVNYSYKDRYFLTGTVRADGSSRFGPNNKWGAFPSVSGGWRIASEPFFSTVTTVSDLKLRASYGLTGNFQIPNFASYPALGNNLNYVLGDGTGSPVIGTSIASLGNPNLKWEKTAQLNVGLDVGILDNRVSFTVDAYRSITSDLLLNVPVGLSSGYSTTLQNIGKVENKGIELSISAIAIDNQTSGFTWNTRFNIYANRNKVLALGPDGTPLVTGGGVAQSFITQIGKPIGNYYGYIAQGVLQTQAQLDAYRAVYKISTQTPQLGDRYYVDTNNDGVVDANDRTIMGNFQPRFSWGFTNAFKYKGFDLSATFQGTQGGKIFNLQRRYIYNNEGNFNLEVSSFNNRYIDPEHPGDGHTIRANRNSNASSQAVNSTFVEDGSYIRLRSLIIGYSFKPSWFKDRISSLRIYASGQNLWTHTHYLFYNPEANARPNNALSQGEDYGSYPLAKTYTFGLTVTF